MILVTCDGVNLFLKEIKFSEEERKSKPVPNYTTRNKRKRRFHKKSFTTTKVQKIYSRLFLIRLPIIQTSFLFKRFPWHRECFLTNSYKWLSIIRTSIFQTLPYFEQFFLYLDVFSLRNSKNKLVWLELPWKKNRECRRVLARWNVKSIQAQI